MTRPCSSVHHHLAIAASSAVSSPALRASTQRSTNVWAISISVAISASTNRLCWNEAIGWPNAVRSLAYSSVRSNAARAAATAVTAIDSRSWGRLVTSETNPVPSSPSRLSTGTRTSSKNSSAVSWACMPTFSRLRPRSNPSMPRSITSSDMPRCRWVGSVFTAVITRSALMPLVMNVFDPLTT